MSYPAHPGFLRNLARLRLELAELAAGVLREQQWAGLAEVRAEAEAAQRELAAERKRREQAERALWGAAAGAAAEEEKDDCAEPGFSG